MPSKFTVLVNPDFLIRRGGGVNVVPLQACDGKARREFLTKLRVGHRTQPGTAGVRASVIDRRGNFIKEAIELGGSKSFHITNYNSPGATGAPAYTAWTVKRLASQGLLDRLKSKAEKPGGAWDFDRVCAAIEAPAS